MTVFSLEGNLPGPDLTAAGATRGEYLGIESAHDDRSILLRNAAGTESIAVADLIGAPMAA